MQDFRKLNVWSRAHAHALAVRQILRGFPRRGSASLRSQMLRSAESIVFNIVEGCGAGSQPEFARFLQIAIRSTMELEYQLQFARDTGFLQRAQWQELSAETIEIRRMLYGLRHKVLASRSQSSR